LMEQIARSHFRIGQWLPLAVDGSRFTTPRTTSNEQAFAAKNYGSGQMARSRAKWKNKKKRSKKLSAPVKPQIWLTLVWHMGLKLPWCWKTVPSNASERDHLIELIQSQKFPEHTLFCGDAGFTGYEFWKALLEQGHHFLVRVGGNVRLLKNLGHVRQGDGVVCLYALFGAVTEPDMVVPARDTIWGGLRCQGSSGCGSLWTIASRGTGTRRVADASLATGVSEHRQPSR
jgi:hypothetical protein